MILPPELPPEVGEEEVEISDEDFDFVKENRDFAGFLTKLDTKSIDRHVNRVADAKEDELEALYERRNRKNATSQPKEEVGLQVDRADALPIKTLDGELKYRTGKESNSVELLDNKEPASELKDRDQNIVRLTKAERRQKSKKIKREAKKQTKEEVKDDHPVEGNLHSEVLAKVEKDLSAEEQFARKKFRLAEVGKQLLEDPELNIRSIKELLQMCNDEDQNVVILGIFSLLAVFKDIIPGYRIRLPTEKELEMPVSKAVLQTRFYESTLLKSYKAYLLRLMALEKQPAFRRAAVRCMCDLLIAIPHFNFRENLLASAVKNISSSDDVVRRRCCEAIKSIFVNEGKHGGEATLEAVRLIADLVKIHECQLYPESLDVFLSLRFDEDLGKSEPKENENVKPKKKRQWRKEEPNQLKHSDQKKSRQDLLTKTREEVTADLKAVSFAPDRDEQRKMQSATLAAVFETYFRILKRSMDPSVSGVMSNSISTSGGFGDHPLLASCLNGLGKFSHLIDLDFMGDLMGCLKNLAGYSDNCSGSSSQNKFSVSERLQCCVVAFKVMRGNLDALNVDLRDFFAQLYNLLLEYRPGRDRGEVLAEALKTMLWEGKQHDMQRAAAFIKRLATFALSCGSAEAMAALVTLKHLLQKNAKCRCLLENDAGGGSLSGLVVKYQPDASDPNLSGALASVLWELSLLSKHYNPTISLMASSISTMATANPSLNQAYLSTASPLQAFEEFSIEKQLSKPITGTPRSINRKRKRGKHLDFVVLKPEKIRDFESSVDEDTVKAKMEDHFKVLSDIAESEKLRAELNRTLASINMYEEYKKQKKKQKKEESLKVVRPKKSKKVL